ncbi:MAG TPA: hypothetical protein VGC14_17885 [Rhizobium sp.]
MSDSDNGLSLLGAQRLLADVLNRPDAETLKVQEAVQTLLDFLTWEKSSRIKALESLLNTPKDGGRPLPKSYLGDDARRAAQAEGAVHWYEQESDAAEEAGDEEAALLWSYLTGNLPADVLLSLYRRHGTEWMRANVPADWEARRIWGHDWLDRSPKELLNHPAYSSEN